MPNVLLHPGDLFCCQGEGRMHTLLGSCVSIILWHKKLRFGWMCHYLLPSRPLNKETDSGMQRPPGFFADEAMHQFDAVIAEKKLHASDFVAKIFGGSNALSTETASDDDPVGERNSRVAADLLIDRNIPLLVAHVGETGSRRIIFDVSNGVVWVRHEAL